MLQRDLNAIIVTLRETQFQVDEDKKAQERMYDLIEKLQQKIKTYKRQLEDAVS